MLKSSNNIYWVDRLSSVPTMPHWNGSSVRQNQSVRRIGGLSNWPPTISKLYIAQELNTPMPMPSVENSLSPMWLDRGRIFREWSCYRWSGSSFRESLVTHQVGSTPGWRPWVKRVCLNEVGLWREKPFEQDMSSSSSSELQLQLSSSSSPAPVKLPNSSDLCGTTSLWMASYSADRLQRTDYVNFSSSSYHIAFVRVSWSSNISGWPEVIWVSLVRSPNSAAVLS